MLQHSVKQINAQVSSHRNNNPDYGGPPLTPLLTGHAPPSAIAAVACWSVALVIIYTSFNETYKTAHHSTARWSRQAYAVFVARLVGTTSSLRVWSANSSFLCSGQAPSSFFSCCDRCMIYLEKCSRCSVPSQPPSWILLCPHAARMTHC